MGAAARFDHLDEIRLTVGGETLAELARVGAQQPAVRRARQTVGRHLRLARNEAPGLDQRDEA